MSRTEFPEVRSLSDGPPWRFAPPHATRIWGKVWPPVLAILIGLTVWQLIVAAGLRPSYVLPGPAVVFDRLIAMLATPKFWAALGTTLARAAAGYAISVIIGTLIGLAVSRSQILRSAIGSLITGLQTMPSIAWFPFAILMFGLTEQAIIFVVVLGAAPSIANGVISGVDDVSPELIRVSRVLGARGFRLYRYTIMPAAFPAYLSGLKQGWAFAWRSLMAGELLVIIANRPSLGVQLQFFREFADAPNLIATMIVILIVGVVIDTMFSAVAKRMRVRRGLDLGLH